MSPIGAPGFLLQPHGEHGEAVTYDVDLLASNPRISRHETNNALFRARRAENVAVSH